MFKRMPAETKNRRIIRVCAILFFAVICVSSVIFTFSERMEKEGDRRKSDKRIYGITVDDSWYESLDTEQVVDAIRDMPVKPTVRIVMSNEISPREYKQLFMKIKREAYVMASPVDSYYMNAYKDRESYLKRFKDSYDELSGYVDIWETGNEINGAEWIKQDPELIMDKVSGANEFIRSKGGKTAVTLYYANPGQEDMFEWISRYFPDDLARNADYVLVSYYEDDNEGCQPEWDSVFSSLEKAFPGAKLGIGECGNTAEDATVSGKVNMARSYYTMEIRSEHFVGGYFWWNWVQDCVPHKNNRVYKEINRCMKR